MSHHNPGSRYTSPSLGRVTLAHNFTGHISNLAWLQIHVLSRQSLIDTFSTCHRPLRCLLAESHWHIFKWFADKSLCVCQVTLAHNFTGHVSNLGLATNTRLLHGRIKLAHFLHVTGQCSVSWQESHWHILKWFKDKALCVFQVTMAHSHVVCR